MTIKTAQLSESERARWQQMVDEVRTSGALEGGHASNVTHAAQDSWVRGEFTFEQMGDAIRRTHPSTVGL
ncbi:antitoxin VbhA family protein [Frondihabitans cladoniiphilus]|uniref:Antitoxin VbhA domain-containing protein n=1 Tax=Frondihabitans cladoniiphilus TaxID=715785 RepID=A0ABP8W943_9MICO